MPDRPSVPKLRPSAALSSLAGVRSRRDSSGSLMSRTDKAQLSQHLDEIHSTASQSESLTTFKDYALPPLDSPGSCHEAGKHTVGETVQSGFSGLYSRLKEAVVTAQKHTTESSDRIYPIPERNTVAPHTNSREPTATNVSVAEVLGTRTEPSTEAPFQSVAISTRTTGSSPGVVTSKIGLASPKFSLKGNTAITTMTGKGTGVTDGVNKEAEHTPAGNLMPLKVALASQVPVEPKLSTTATNATGAALPPNALLSPFRSLSKTSEGDDIVDPAGHLDILSTAAKSQTSDGSGNYSNSLAERAPSRSQSRTPAVIDRISRPTPSAGPPTKMSMVAKIGLSRTSEPAPARLETQTVRAGPGPGAEANSVAVSARLQNLRSKLLSKDFWMADQTCNECFACQTPFTTFHRKHHCRTCGRIFDSKCTTIIPAQKFGLPGTVRLCNICLDVINQRLDNSGSDDSGDDESTFFGAVSKFTFARAHAQKAASRGSFISPVNNLSSIGHSVRTPEIDETLSSTTPMMAIAATRRMASNAHRGPPVLEIESVHQLSRPSSSRSLRSINAGKGTPGSGHRRQQSRGSLLGRYKFITDERDLGAPFRKSFQDDTMSKKGPAFLEDNVFDPELAPFLSDESSSDEQISIAEAMENLGPGMLDADKASIGNSFNASKKHKKRQGNKSIISGQSYNSRGVGSFIENHAAGHFKSHSRSLRRGRLSDAGLPYYLLTPRPLSGGKSINKAFPTGSTEMLVKPNSSFDGFTAAHSMPHTNRIDLGPASMSHIKNLLYQLLQDYLIPNPSAWEKALVPILLQCTDDIKQDIPSGDDIDIRHYVKLKKIPGAKPSDINYVSGVVFTKRLALKAMRRSISRPRILLVAFPIEYQRREQHFMSLQPVIEQEREFLRVVVNRIRDLGPHVLFAEKNVSGIALEYLNEAGIAVAFNVKRPVIEALARCCRTDIITSIDMLAIPGLVVGGAGKFEVKTYVDNDHPSRKKTYIFLSGCDRRLGCTISLRGASADVLSKMKRITEFMVYVVYNLKLESCFMADSRVNIPKSIEQWSSAAPTPKLPVLSKVPSEIFPKSRAPVDAAPLVETAESKEAKTTASEATSSKDEPQNVQKDVDDVARGKIDYQGDNGASRRPGPPPRLVSLHQSHTCSDNNISEDIPMPTFYSDLVAKYETKILSASPFVKFAQPYLLMQAREQERKLVYLRRLRDQDMVEEQQDQEKQHPKFQLVEPEMLHELDQRAPRQVMEVLHAAHDAEYDKALYNYETHTRQWENLLQGTLDLFDPFSHQSIAVLYSVTCTETKIPCIEPSLVGISFYDELHNDADAELDPDCTLGQYVEDLCLSAEQFCTANSCGKKMSEHHRTYVHDEARITLFVNKETPRPNDTDSITMWSVCKICRHESDHRIMSENSWKYSFGKFLELSFWCRGLALKDSDCSHDYHRDHIRFFRFQGYSLRIHYDPIDLLEIVVPRTRITWKVVPDLRLKNEIFTRTEETWNRFMNSVKARLSSIHPDTVLPEKVEDCTKSVAKLIKKASDDHLSFIGRLQDAYMNSKYYEIIPMNRVFREMLEKAEEWDAAFTQFEADFLPEKDMRQITILQLKKMFTDSSEEKEQDSVNEKIAEAVAQEEAKLRSVSMPTSKLAGSNAEDEPAHPPLPGASSELPTFSEKPSKSPEDVNKSPETPGKLLEVIDGTSESSAPLAEKAEVRDNTQAIAGAEKPVVGEANTDLHVPEPLVDHPSTASAETAGNSGVVPPTIARAATQPAVKTIRPLKDTGKSTREACAGIPETVAPDATDETLPQDAEANGAKKQPDQGVLNGGKNTRKPGPSAIPRFVGNKKATKVLTLTKHFEQLSRELEREQMKDRNKYRTTKPRDSKAYFPRMSTKAVVRVYDNVDRAFEEVEVIALPDEQVANKPRTGPNHALLVADKSPLEGPSDLEEIPTTDHNVVQDPTARPEPPVARHQQESDLTFASDYETPSSHAAAQNHSASDEEESEGEEADPALVIDEIKDIAECIEVGEEVPELKKHQKSSLMKILSNFWAERSASSWPSLKYPLNDTDHVFLDSDIIVREDEPSSLISFVLGSEDYLAKLDEIRRQSSPQKPAFDATSETTPEYVEKMELKNSLLRPTGTHLKYQFQDDSARMLCKIFYVEQFDSLRRKCGVADRIVESLSRCLKWDSKGGKTRSVFLKTLDGRLVMKSLSPVETAAFLRFAPNYFNLMSEALFNDLPSVIAKMLGFFQVIIKNPATGVDMKLDLLLMENLFYDRSPSRIFDLKGSMRNRRIEETGEENEVLLDENMVEYIYESPLFAREHSKKIMRASVWNDTLFLARQNVMDYSLMIAIEAARQELVVGIIDCIRTYTWDKKLESWIKDKGFAGGGRNRPTITGPKEYKTRFREAMGRYILEVPDSWHLFQPSSGSQA